MRAAGEGAGDDPREQLVAIGHAYLRFARERPGHYAVLFQRHITPEPEEDEESTVGMHVFESLVEVVRRCGVAEDDAFDSGVLLWMALHGRAAVTSAMPAFPFPDEDVGTEESPRVGDGVVVVLGMLLLPWSPMSSIMP